MTSFGASVNKAFPYSILNYPRHSMHCSIEQNVKETWMLIICYVKTTFNHGRSLGKIRQTIYYTPGSRQIGDFARAKDTLSEIIVDIDTMIH